MSKLNVFCQNIHQQGRNANWIPLWIIDYFEKNTNVVILNEFNCKAANIQDFYRELIERGFEYFVTNYNHTVSANDTLIAIKKSREIKIQSVSYVSAYNEPQKTNSTDIDYEMIPENLRVDISVDERIISIIGVRIKTLQGNQEKRLQQFEFLIKQIKQIPNDVIVGGDFNNNRILGNEDAEYIEVEPIYKGQAELEGIKGCKNQGRPFDSEKYNYQKIRSFLKKEITTYNMFSPKENQSSIGAIWDCVNQKAVLPPFTKTSNNKYDHIITNLVMDNISYDWSFLQHYCVNSERYFKNKGIEIGYPDHAILIAEITFSGIDN